MNHTRREGLHGRAFVIMAATVAVVGGAATSAHAATPAPSTTGRVAVHPAANGDSPAADIADTVQKAAQAHYADRYVGEILTDNGTRVVVYLTQSDHTALSPTMEQAITAGVAPGVVSFAVAPRSLAYLNQLHHQVTTDQAALKQQGIDIVTWGPDFTTGREHLAVYRLTAAESATLQREFGSANIAITTTSSSYTAVALGRSNDVPPWNGGDFEINDPVTGECSSGFGAHNGSTEYLVTAGHCFAAGNEVINGDPSLNGSQYTIMGTVASRGSFGVTDGIDAETINTTSSGSSSSAVYTGSSTAPQVATVRGTTSSPAGDQVCASGAFEGEICGLVLQATSPMPECITEAESSTVTYVQCDIYQADNTSGGIAVGNGDSGGPVFRFSGSSLYATGIVTAGGGTESVCPTYQSPDFATRYCFPDLFYTDVRPVLSEFGLTINT